MNNKRIPSYITALLLGAVFTIPFNGNAQNNTRSPYSMYGLGELRSQVNAVNSAMGGAGIAMSSKTFINSMNPASYNGIDSLNFIFDTGVEGKNSQFKSMGETQKLNTGNFSYFSFGFRVTPKIAMAFGLNPFSSTGYEINTTSMISGLQQEYPMNIIGTGDISRAYGGASFSLAKNLSVGVKSSFLFGNIKQTQLHNLSVIGSTSVYNETTDYFHNFYFEFGAQYAFKVDDYNVSVGAIYNPEQILVSTRENITSSSAGSTFTEKTENNSDFKIPEELGFGVAVSYQNKLSLALDAGLQKWSTSDYNVLNVRLNDNPYVRFGVQYTPSSNFMDSYLKKIDYRLGWRYAKSYLSLKDNQLEEKAFTFGLGLPIRNQRSKIDVSGELGSFGTTAKSLIQEKYFRLRVGFSLKDLWFQQRKFD